MPEMSKEELRRWSAEICYPGEIEDSPHLPAKWIHKNNPMIGELTWHPDIDTAPAWQILAVIQAIQERGWSLEIYFGESGSYDVVLRSIKSPGPLKKITLTEKEKPFSFFLVLKAVHAALEGKS